MSAGAASPEGGGPSTQPWRPTPAQIEAARGSKVPDVIRPGLAILFVGINPGLYSGAVGHHFARPGNRFWEALRGSGLTDRVLSPFEERTLLDRGLGITNLVERATARADELGPDELRTGARRLRSKACRLRPSVVAFLGISAYRVAFGLPRARIGPQPNDLCGARVWVLPNPSGLNAHYQRDDLAEAFGDLRRAMERERKGVRPRATPSPTGRTRPPPETAEPRRRRGAPRPRGSRSAKGRTGIHRAGSPP